MCSLVGCGSASNKASQSNTLVYTREGEADVLDPIQTDVGETVKVIVNLYEPLVAYAEKSMEIVPCLATEWEANDDQTQWRFQLREGVKFHDGTEFNADAVVFTFGRFLEEDHPHAYTQVRPYAGSFRSIDRVEATGPLEVVFHLKEIDAAFLDNLTMFSASIVSPTAVKSSKEAFGAKPVGTGPFRLARWQRGVQLELERFEDYWDGAVSLERVIFVPGNESQVRRKQLLRGEAHLADNLPPRMIDELGEAPHLEILSQDALNVGYLSMQTEKPPLDDPRVRRAIWHALNKQRLVDDVYDGHADVAVSMLPPGLLGYNDGLTNRAYDIAAAKKLLDEAGVDRPLKLTLYAMETPRPYMQRPRETAVFIKGQLAEIGIEVDILTQENNDHFQQLNQGEHQLALAGWSSDNNDPANFLYQLLHSDNARANGNNNSRFRNAELDRLLDTAAQTVSRDERAELYRQAQQVIYDNAPTVPLVHVPQRVVQNQRVKGYSLHPASLVRLKWTSLAPK